MKNDLDPIWMKAAVAGGLWASFEIIVGSMLHNLHIPFSGTMLATFSVVLMISFVQIWNTRGLIWRAGIVCGLMKSLSPSAVILGPMTGIMMEAFLMELMIFLAGRNLAGYILGGITALLSAILHKLTSLFILYGTDLVTIYLNLFEFIKKQLNIPGASAGDLILGLIVIYMVLGAVAAIAGTWMGRRALKSRPDSEPIDLPGDPFATAWQKTDPGQKFRILLLFLHLLSIPILLFTINRFGLRWPALAPSIIYILFLLLYYPRIKHRLLKPFFWSQLMMMILIAALFYRSGEPGFFHPEGVIVGLEMCLRAILIVSTFSGLSVEIRNPRITRWLLGLGLENAYSALSLAFNSLPVMLDRSTGLTAFLRKPVGSFTMLIYEAELWLRSYQTHLEK